MKIIIFTNQTTHHTKFVMDIISKYPNTKVVQENTSLKAPFDTYHVFQSQQETYERDFFFDGKDIQIVNIVSTLRVENINDLKTEKLIKLFSPDIILVFGTSRINRKIIGLMPGRILNLHGGNPTNYRGLDSHLWAIYHGHFDELVTSIHLVEPELDTGNLIDVRPLDLKAKMQFYQLRAENTKCCIGLALNAVNEYESTKNFKFMNSGQKGRYYSFMPSVLKELCVKKFNQFTENI